MYITGSGNHIEFENVIVKLKEFYNNTKHYESNYQIIVGTDSQNHSDTTVVNVIAMVCEGHGGIFFYEKTTIPKVRDVKIKLQIETNESLNVALKLLDILEKDEELYLNCPISIHVDAGNSSKGKTKELIPELLGWINSCGFNASVKPNSFAASSIADKFSK